MDDSVTSVNLESTFAISCSMRGSMSDARRSAMGSDDSWEEARKSGERNRRRRRSGAAPTGLHDSSELVGGPTDVVVHDHRVELGLGDLFLGVGPGQAPLHRLGIVGGAALQPA